MLKKFDERKRLREVSSYKIEDTLTEKEYDDIAFLASAICGTPIAIVTFMYEDRQWFKAAVGTDLKENKRDLSFCTHAIAGEEDVMVVENANEDVRFIHNPLVQGEPHLVFYAGAPIVNKNGYSIGTVCVYDVVKKSLTNEQIKGLKILSEQVMGLLELRKQNLRLENDIHKKVEVHKQIEASEQRLSNERMVLYNSFMNAPAAIAILKGDTHIYEFANAEYEKIVERKITIGKTVQELFPEVAQQGLIDILNKVFSTGEPFIANEFPVELINKKTGKLVLGYYNSVLQPMKDENGNTERLLSHGVEVTKQVEARKQIEESEKRFSMLADSIPNLAWMAYADGNIFWYNEKWFEYTGTTLAQMEGWGWQSVHDPKELQKVLTKWKGSIETGKPFEMVFPIKGADGKFRQFLTRVLPVLDSENKIYRWIGTNTDISKQTEAEEKIKESETKFRTLSETIPHMVWTATPDGKRNFFNKYFIDYTGLSFEKLKGNRWHKIIYPDDLQKELVHWLHAIKTGEDFKIEKRVRHHDGTHRWHLSHSIAQKDKDGNITGWIGTNTDIDEQKIKEEQKDEFISIASHELKTPLTIAKTYIQLLTQTFEESGKEHERELIYTTKANASIDRLNRLISELLDVSKIQSGKLPLNITSFNFDEMFTDTIESLQHTLPKHSIIYSGETKRQVSGDKERLQQVIINLINNAAKYSPNADKIFVHISDCEKGEIKFEVKDTGIGITKNDLEKIFERYYRVENMTGQFQGLGIGLFISSQIIRRHNGKLWAESEPGVGSTFYFTLPC